MSDSLEDLMSSGLDGLDDINEADDINDGNDAKDPKAANAADDANATKDDGLDTINWADQARQDDEDISRMFAEPGQGSGVGLGLDKFADKVLDQSGKADDAEDFEDISDLASDDGSAEGQAPDIPTVSQDPGLTEDSGDNDISQYPDAMELDDAEGDMDDLFGDAEDVDRPLPSSPVAGASAQPVRSSPPPAPSAVSQNQNATEEDFSKMTAEEIFLLNFPQQQENDVSAWLLDQATQDPSVPAPPQNIEQLLEQTFPGFAPHKVLFFRELFPEWPAEYVYKEPPKSPPELVPTKLELDLEADSSKLFRIPESALVTTQKKAQQHYSEGDEWGRLMGATAVEVDEVMSDSDDDIELVGGYSLAEIATVCDNWDDIYELPKPSTAQQNGLLTPEKEDEEMDEWDREFLQPQQPQTQPKKKRKLDLGLPDISTFDSVGIENFVDTTKRFARRVQLDLNDPYLLLEDVQNERPSKRPRIEEKSKRMANGQLGRDVNQRFNISNDEAYSALKANNKSKVRATLSNLAVEHSMPALKLTFPFYRTKLAGEFWEHHRKKLDVDKIVRHAITFRKAGKVRRRDTKGKPAQVLFRTSKELSLNDNSSAILFEYSEQSPVLLSNFGMGSRVINYYRRKDPQDEEKPPKAEIGEPHVLLPEDRSPFSIFGTVDPGETVPTLHNEMYRAPIFKHEPRKNDFLLGYSTNATDGPKFYLRAIDHLYVVGQTFPSLEVPGPHARKVTNTSKNRLKMISYRMMKKSATQDVSLDEVTPHVFEKKDPQNRQKMKEFLSYERDTRTYRLPDGQTMMDETAIRAMIKPEDVCMIEAMQVGQSQLLNAGYDPKTAKDGEDDEDAEAELPLVVKMAPWEITKNFIEASAGKAMVALHGEGDPTGHGLGFSFIKTSMKGGYINAVQGPLATSADAIERERKANGGHSYNVKKQQDMYNAAIQDIWGRQKASLNDATTHEDSDVLDTANEDDRFETRKQYEYTPAAQVDDGRSQFSRMSGGSRLGRRKIKITRKKTNEDGEIVTETHIISDPAVIKSYVKQRRDLDDANRDIYAIKVTGDADADRESHKLVQQELDRLLKNADRRKVREKQGKGKKKNANADAGSPDPSGSADKAAGGTTRKCANCGQVGHIKTNKSKCPLLNGTITPNNNAPDHGGFGSFTAPAVGGATSETG